LCKSKGTNCEATIGDENPIIFDPIRPQHKINSNNSTLSSNSDTECISNLSLSSMSSDKDSINCENINNDVTLEDCSVSYIAGYFGYKCMNKFNCDICQNELSVDKNLNDKKQLHLLNKNNTSIENESGLNAPSNSLNNVVNKVLNIFEKNYKNYLHK